MRGRFAGEVTACAMTLAVYDARAAEWQAREVSSMAECISG